MAHAQKSSAVKSAVVGTAIGATARLEGSPDFWERRRIGQVIGASVLNIKTNNPRFNAQLTCCWNYVNDGRMDLLK